MPNSRDPEIAVLQSQMSDVKASLETIKSDQHSNFQALALKIDGLSNTPLEINSINERLITLEKQKGLDWLWKTLSAAAGAALAILIGYAITKH